jgi:hypothetical protein
MPRPKLAAEEQLKAVRLGVHHLPKEEINTIEWGIAEVPKSLVKVDPQGYLRPIRILPKASLSGSFI